MNILLYIIYFVIGFASGAIFIIIPLTSIFFNIPFTVKMMRENAIRGLIPVMKNILTIILHPVIITLITWGMYSWNPESIVAYWIGISLGVLTSIGQCGATPINKANYLLANVGYIKKGMLHKFESTSDEKYDSIN